MNEPAIFHTMEPPYLYAINEKEVIVRFRAAKGDVKSAEILYEDKYCFYLKHKSAPLVEKVSDRLFDYFIFRLKLDKSRLAYVFYVEFASGEKRYFSEDGLTDTYDFPNAHFHCFQYPFVNSADIQSGVDWMENAVFYQIFVDRFLRGDSEKPSDYINLAWGEKPASKSFAGGDLSGIESKLDYLAGLNINALYLTPVFKSVSNHKYDISDYFNVDPQFGGNKALSSLIESAHSRGMKVVLDAVFNHCSEHLDKFRDAVKKGRKSKYFDWFVVHGDYIDCENCNYEVFASCKYMPKFNTSNPEVQDYLLKIAKFWAEKYGIDGWRLDVSDEVSHDFWRAFRKEVKSVNPDLVIIGENWHDASAYLKGDQYDSIMNYAFTKTALDYLAYRTADAEAAANRLNSILMRNTCTVNRMMLNLIDCHDTHRFITLSEDKPEALAAALALMTFFPGAPMFYYGDELALPGGYDPDCRRCFDWTKKDEDIPLDMRNRVRTLAQLKRSNPALWGSEANISAENGVLRIDRTGGGRTVSLFINGNDKARAAFGETIAPNDYLIKA